MKITDILHLPTKIDKFNSISEKCMMVCNKEETIYRILYQHNIATSKPGSQVTKVTLVDE